MTIIANQAAVAIRNAQLFNRINAQQRQLEAFLHAIPDVLLILDQSGRILMVNDAAMELLGDVTRVDITGRHLAEVATEEAFNPVIEVINSPGDSTRWSFEVRSQAREQDYQVTMARWQDMLRDIAGYVIVLHDVTGLRELHRFKDEMLRVASHDLRSPLALIIGYADMIELDTPDPESPVHEYVDIIRRSTERMGTLLEDLLRVERIRNSPLELHEEVNLAKLVKVVQVNMRPSATAKSQQFATDIRLDEMPGVLADPVLLRQSMENLIGNAIKYTSEGGTVTIRAYVSDERFHFVVEDTGVGIAPEHLSHVFDSFYRVASDSSEKGAGLGLSLVKNVIQRHDGDVWVTSEKGKGSQFGFWLPLKRNVS